MQSKALTGFLLSCNLVLITISCGIIARFAMTAIDNICILGDSVLLGVTYDDSRGRYSILRDGALTAFTRKLGFKVHSLCKMGQTSAEAALKFTEALESGLRPDAVLIELGGNDCNMPWDDIAAKPDGEFSPAVSLGFFRGTLRGIIRTAMKYGIKPLVCSLPPLAADKFLGWVSKDEASKLSILSYLGDSERIYRWQEMYSLEAVRVAAEESAELVDLRGSFLSMKGYQDLICKDGIHPNAGGHRLIKEVLVSSFEEAAKAGSRSSAATA